MDYIPISKAFQALKCVIKARDPRLQRISVAAPGFLIFGPIPEGILATGPIPEGIPKVAQPPQHTVEEGISSYPAFIKKEEEKEEVVEAFNSKDEFEIFNQILSPKALSGDLRSPSLAQSNLHQEAANTSGDMGIQRR